MNNKVIEKLNNEINISKDDNLDISSFIKPGISFEELSQLIQDEHEEYKLKDIKRLILKSYQEKLQEQQKDNNKVIR